MNFWYSLSIYIVQNIPKAVTLLTCLFFFGIILNFIENKFLKRWNKNIYHWIKIISVISLGILFRLSFAYFLKGNFDLHYWYEMVNLTIRGHNIYTVTSGYNYFPIWIIILTILKKINLLFFPKLHFYFMIKLFLTLVDLMTLFLLCLILKLKHKNINYALFGYFLNPVIIIITGVHGQFESLAAFFVILGLYLYLKNNFLHAWLAYTLGGLTKHMFVNQIIIYLNHIFKDKKRVVIYFAFSTLIALLILVPYLAQGKESIINNLFLYSYTTDVYGFLNLLSYFKQPILLNIYRYLFMILFLFWPLILRVENLSKKMLLGSLFFIVFTPGIGDQYFVIPIAMGILNINFWFYLYSLITTLYFLGSSAQFNLNLFKCFSNNYIWFVALCWFGLELLKSNEKKID